MMDRPRRYKIFMDKKKRIALIAHDRRKRDLLEWVSFNLGTLSQHELYATGTTGPFFRKNSVLRCTG